MSKVTLDRMKAALEHYFQPLNLSFTRENFFYCGKAYEQLCLDKSLIVDQIQQDLNHKLFYAQKIRMTGCIIPSDPTIPSYRMDDVKLEAQIELVDGKNSTLQRIFCYELEELPIIFQTHFPKRRAFNNHDIKQELQKIKTLIDKLLEALPDARNFTKNV